MAKVVDIKKVDQNFANQETKVNLRYINPALSKEVKIYGLNWFDADQRYVRFPKESDEMIKELAEGLFYLVEQPSGAMAAFKSNTKTLKIKVKLGHTFDMGHMAFTGQGGFDIYIGNSQDELKFFRTSSYNIHNKEYEFTFFDKWEKKERYFLLNFPLYGAVEKLEIGIENDAQIEPVNQMFTNGKIAIYGTSITQGGCASRPGISFTNAISRLLNYEILNFGFSGNGRGQQEVAELIASIKDLKMFIMDYEANVTFAQMQQTFFPFLEIIRKYHPNIPILVVSKIRMSIETHNEAAYHEELKRLKYQSHGVKQLQQTDSKIYFLDGHKLLGKYAEEATVDGCHPTDLGFMMITEKLSKVISKILNEN